MIHEAGQIVVSEQQCNKVVSEICNKVVCAIVHKFA